MADVVATVGLDANGFDAGMRRVVAAAESSGARMQTAFAKGSAAAGDDGGGRASRWERLAAGSAAYALAVRMAGSAIEAYAKQNETAARAVEQLSVKWQAFKAGIGRDIFDPVLRSLSALVDGLNAARSTATDVLATVFSGGIADRVIDVTALQRQIEGQEQEAKIASARRKLELDSAARLAELDGRAVDAAKARAELEFTSARERINSAKDLDSNGKQAAIAAEKRIRDARVEKAIADERARVEGVQAERVNKLAQERLDQDRKAADELAKRIQDAAALSQSTRDNLVSSALDALKVASPQTDVDAAKRRLDLENQIAEVRASAMIDSEKTLLENQLRRLADAQDVLYGQREPRPERYAGYGGSTSRFAARMFPNGRAGAASVNKVSDDRVLKAAQEIRDVLKTFVNTKAVPAVFSQ